MADGNGNGNDDGLTNGANQVPGRGPTKPQRGPWEPTPRDLQIYARLCEGQTTREVAKEFDLTHGRIVQLGQQIDRWLAPQLMDSIREIKARHTEHLMHIFRQAMAAWERSKLDSVATTEKSINHGEHPGTETAMTTKTQAGHPAFLAEARAALSDIRKIWGADAPVDVRMEGELRVAGMPLDDARRLYAERQVERFQRLLKSWDN
jgi:hypothetical protein